MKTKDYWPTDARLIMIQKSKTFYNENKETYQFGYYDGFQKGYNYPKHGVNTLIISDEQLATIRAALSRTAAFTPYPAEYTRLLHELPKSVNACPLCDEPIVNGFTCDCAFKI